MPGGVLKPIPENVQGKVIALAPDIDWERLRFAAENYGLQLGHDAQAPKPMQKDLGKIADAAIKLQRDIALLSEEGLDALCDGAGAVGGFQFIEQVQSTLFRLSSSAKSAHNAVEIKSGNPGSERKAFAVNVADILQDSGCMPETPQNGKYCQILGLLLTVYGDCPTDLRKLAETALASRGLRKRKQLS